MCSGKTLCVFVYVCAPGQGGVGELYIAITLLFLLMTVIAEMMVGGEFGGGTGSGGGGGLEKGGGMVREAGRCSVHCVQPDS